MLTQFEIKKTPKGYYRFLLKFNTRFAPIILTGNRRLAPSDCLVDIEKLKNNINYKKFISFLPRENNSFRFVVHSRDGTPVAYSRSFPTKRLMIRILAILKNHIARKWRVAIETGKPILT
jgi:uncharacterized protein YegP (UPF0339 family)